MSQPKNIFYAQSGGATAVINASAYGVIQAAKEHATQIGRVYAGHHGILGALREELIDVYSESSSAIDALAQTPGCAFGSCRYKLKSIDTDQTAYKRLIDVFAAHDIGYFFYNGGGDSQDTAHKVSQMSQRMNFPLTCIGIPKTIDNDLAHTDCSPGFASVAKYVAISTQEAALDIAGMAATSTKVFILEVMGRHSGWIAAAAGLAKTHSGAAPHIILFPEQRFDPEQFLAACKQAVVNHGYCVIVASEGIRDASGRFLSESSQTDAFGHAQLGGVAPKLAKLIHDAHGYKYHWAVADYLQRAARHIASQVDVDHAIALGRAAVTQALNGENNIMLTIERTQQVPYQWDIGQTPLSSVANIEKTIPEHFIDHTGYAITDACHDYLSPLIHGEAYPLYENGLPVYAKLKKNKLTKKLKVFEPA